MNREKLARVVDSLRSRRDHPQTTAEEALACEVTLDRLRGRHGAEAVDELLAHVGELVVEYTEEWERLAIVHVAEWLGLSAWGRPDETGRVLVTGPERLVRGFSDLWKIHRGILEDLVLGALGGYLYAAMPRPKTDEEVEEAPSDATALGLAQSSDFEAALRLGARAGASMQTGIGPGASS